jgi:UDP-3-O-[3-hydroxymyristoyl] glucosamine N-acyltransferase
MFSVAELANLLQLSYQGEGTRVLTRVSSLEDADASSLIFLDGKGSGETTPSSAGCVIAQPHLVSSGWTAILSQNPKLDFARAANYLLPRPRGAGVHHPNATVEVGAILEAEVDLAAGVVVSAGTRIGRGSILHAGVVVSGGCVLGDNCILHPRVVLYPDTQLGNRVTIHAGTVIGGDGFGYVFDGRQQVKFPQVGGAVVEDDVEIGCNTTVDRGSLGTTRISAGAKIDNLVQIGHNVQIGRAVVIAAQTGISGSTVIEDFAVIGGQVGFGDHARVESGAIIGSKAGVLPGKIVRGGEVYWGVPVRPLREYKKLNALFGRLPEMKEQIERLQEQVRRLEEELKNRGENPE